MTERKLVRIEVLDEVLEHLNADSLELAVIGGWQVCVRKGEFRRGDRVLFIEVDSMLPLTDPRFEAFGGRNDKVVDGIAYARIRTMRLRKELSQGLILSTEILKGDEDLDNLDEDLGVIKFEPSLPANLSGNIKGNFPEFIPKTNQERIQNMSRLHQDSLGKEFEVSYKLDGSSFTAFSCLETEIEDGADFGRLKLRTGVCSRNLELKLDETNEGNSFVQCYFKYDLAKKLEEHYWEAGECIAIQGEMVAPNIQSNFEGVEELSLYVYSVYSITLGKYMLPSDAKELTERLGLNYVPLFLENHVLKESVKEILEMADGESGLNGKFREGLVFKSKEDSSVSFKAISNRYLLKTNN